MQETNERIEASQIEETEQNEPTDNTGAEESASEAANDGMELDYERMASEDLAEIKRLFPSFSDISHLRELDRAERFGEMREAGLSVEEALMATNYERIFEAIVKKARAVNGKSHLQSRVPTAAGGEESGMTGEQMRQAKEMFDGLSEREIQSLYKRAIS